MTSANTFTRYGTVATLFVLAAVLNGLTWWVRSTTIPFNIYAFYLSSGILAVNLILAAFVMRRERLLGLLLAGASGFAQILFFILLAMSRRGAVL